MTTRLSRRTMLSAALTAPLLTLPGCAGLGQLGGLGGFGFDAAIRRILTVSAERAFASLLDGDGYFAGDLARLALPPELQGAGGIAAGLLRQPVVRQQLFRLVDRAAAGAAENIAPLVYDSIRSMTIADAIGIVRGGPTAATDFFERSMGDRIVGAFFPEMERALRGFDDGILSRVLSAASGIDFSGFGRSVTRGAAEALFTAIGREEAAIRRDPGATGDPLLSSVFALAR